MTALAYRTACYELKTRYPYKIRTPKPTEPAEASYEEFKTDYVSEFYELVRRWKAETALLSTTREMMQTPAFSRLADMGDAIIPLLLDELKQQPSFLFLVLHMITKENPVPASAQGRVGEIVNAWLTWGQRNRRHAD